MDHGNLIKLYYILNLLFLGNNIQHYANRIADFWEESKRVLQTDLRTDVVEENDPITPLSHLVLANGHYRTLAISHQWRDDVTTVKMIQSLIEIEGN